MTDKEYESRINAIRQMPKLWVEWCSYTLPEKYDVAAFERIKESMKWEYRAHKKTVNNPAVLTGIRGQMILLGKLRKVLLG